jgi:serine/threonine-protein kinase
VSGIACERVALGPAVGLRLSGVIDERFDAGAVFGGLGGAVVLDLAGIKRITSFGVRQWSDAMKVLHSSITHLYLLAAPSCFVDQLNMVLNFGGRSEVITATALYFCDRCQEERAIAIDVLGDRPLLASGAAPAAPCPNCGTPMALEEDPQQAFRYVKVYGAQAIEPEVAAALAKEGLYTPRKVGPPPEEMKLVHGDVTLLVLTGTLDQRFRPRRLAAGVEGEVVLDTGGVGAVDATGAERFRQLMNSLEEGGKVTLVDLPAPLLREVANGGMTLGRANLVSALLEFSCPACGAERRASVTHAQGASYRPPCERCGEPTLLSGAGPWLERAFSSQPVVTSPSAVQDVIARRAELLSRARAESGARSQAPDSALGRYRVLRPLSRGGMAEILLAVHEGIGGFEKLIALKKIRRRLLERRHVAVELFLNEAKIVANLNHPNIVQTFEVGEHGGDLFIAMEYVHGVDARTVVKRRIEKGDRLTLEQVLYIGTQVAAALDHAHKARDLGGRPLHIVHRDVSLSNIVIGFDGQVKLVDFGIATAASVTAKDGLIGKFSYMSPEQVNKEPLDGRSDVFSLGIVLHELIAGKPLFRRESDDATLLAVREAPVPSLSEFGVTPAVEEVIRRSLERRRDERYADARAFELALQSALQQLGGMSAHQLSIHMRAMFPEQSAAAPTATFPGFEATRHGTPGNTPSDPSAHSDGFSPRSNTFEPRLFRAGENEVTKDLPDPPPAPAPRPALARLTEHDTTATPSLGVVALRDPPTPSPAPSPTVEASAPPPARSDAAVTPSPSLPSRPPAAPAPSSAGRSLVLVVLLLAAAALVWFALRG